MKNYEAVSEKDAIRHIYTTHRPFGIEMQLGNAKKRREQWRNTNGGNRRQRHIQWFKIACALETLELRRRKLGRKQRNRANLERLGCSMKSRAARLASLPLGELTES